MTARPVVNPAPASVIVPVAAVRTYFVDVTEANVSFSTVAASACGEPLRRSLLDVENFHAVFLRYGPIALATALNSARLPKRRTKIASIS